METKQSTVDLSYKNLSGILILFVAIWLYFFATAIDQTDWWIENILVFIFIAVMFSIRKRFQFSNKAICFIFLFLILHIYGAKMAYTQNELGEYFQNRFNLTRNPYDRIVHFSFGFLMLYPLVELSRRYLQNKMLFVLIFANLVIAFLATTFELIEWGVASCTDQITGETYVATQGDPWDAQKDIALAILGSFLMSMPVSLINRKTVQRVANLDRNLAPRINN